MGKAYIYYHEMMANADRFVIKLTGKGGHGSAPQDAIDVIYISGHLIEMIHNIVSREIDPQEAAVITIGTINAGFRFNVIASHAELTGTVRTFNNDTQAKIERRIKEILEGLKLTYRIDYEYDYIKGYPVLINNEEVSRIIEKMQQRFLVRKILFIQNQIWEGRILHITFRRFRVHTISLVEEIGKRAYIPQTIVPLLMWMKGL